LLEELREGLADRTVILVTHNAADISDDDDRLVLTGAGQPAQSEPVPVA
jgi:ATP-binding cassette subfamily C protein CydCD